ncbi:aminotransferase class V-fold PLP-dependent enzyme [Pseudonocardia endophytica]|uniref:Selenocysteine lyase/cysteine desulfurase n=1 Tax=Pseudonocardia endophytica TaxID=401976 RepID=A0A4R1I5M4_PSEEN|nr:aminotransferase class V-fold PLP-dependent enzyme [Pseudonocardia endophytica]TCK25362.1 selenocysteine lyase/cysteine desulfurase [Pseudonocardia endophytica]
MRAFGQDFRAGPGYLNTASIGLPPAVAAEAVADAVADWATGRARPPSFDGAVETARAGFAALIGVAADRVACGSTVSALVGLLAASVPDGTRVLVVAGEFGSVTHPFAVQVRGVTVTEVPPDRLGELAPAYDLVAVSVVQSADGRIADLDALRAAHDGGTRVLLDVTQAAGWLPLRLDWADAVVGAGYKWLLCPRGSSWLALHPSWTSDPTWTPVPHAAGWYGNRDRWGDLYTLGPPRADGPAGLDTSPDWLSQVGAAVTLPWLAGLDAEQVRAHCVGLADSLRERLGMAPAGSAIVAVDRPGAAERLTGAGLVVASRAGAARVSFHLANTGDDVDRAARAIEDR